MASFCRFSGAFPGRYAPKRASPVIPRGRMVRTCLLMGVPINPRRGMLVVACPEQWKPTMVESLQKHKFEALTAKVTSPFAPSRREVAPAHPSASAPARLTTHARADHPQLRRVTVSDIEVLTSWGGSASRTGLAEHFQVLTKHRPSPWKRRIWPEGRAKSSASSLCLTCPAHARMLSFACL